MKRIIIFISIVVTGYLFEKCTQAEKSQSTPEIQAVLTSDKPVLEKQIERGAYLVNAIGCDDCHSPKIMGPQGPEIDPEKRMSGRPGDQPLPKIKDRSILKDYALFSPDLTAAVGPWGTSFSANLTPDDTGIGTWTEEQFLKAIKEGKLKGLDASRTLLPPMPWYLYKNLTDEDLKAIFVYLQTLKPVKNVVPAPLPPAS